MNTLIHTFDADGYYAGTSEMPPFAAEPNPACATLDPLPTFNPEIERARRVAGAWAVELIPLPDPDPEPEPQEPTPPTTCTPAQGLVALYALRGVTEQDLLTAIAGIADPVARYTAQVGLQRATTWSRESPTMHAVAALLGLSESDLDALFEYAVTVSV